MSNLSQNLNSTAPFNTTLPSIIVTNNVWLYLDNIVRIVSLVVHILYFLVVFTHRELRPMSMWLTHHANFIGLVSAINFMAWYNSTAPSIPANTTLYHVVCSLGEAAWAVIKFARAYAILILGVYRFLAVYKLNMYKRVSQSYLWTLSGSLAAWIAATIVFLAGKFIGGTTYGLVFCTDGYSTNTLNSGIYYIIVTVFGYLLPILLVIVFFFLVKLKLQQMSVKLGKNKTQQVTNSLRKQQETSKSGENASTVSARMSTNRRNDELAVKRREQRVENTLAVQFISLNGLELISAISLTCINISLFVPNFNVYYYYVRQLLRTISNIAQSLIPIMSLIFHPFKLKIPFISN